MTTQATPKGTVQFIQLSKADKNGYRVHAMGAMRMLGGLGMVTVGEIEELATYMAEHSITMQSLKANPKTMTRDDALQAIALAHPGTELRVFSMQRYDACHQGPTQTAKDKSLTSKYRGCPCRFDAGADWSRETHYPGLIVHRSWTVSIEEWQQGIR